MPSATWPFDDWPPFITSSTISTVSGSTSLTIDNKPVIGTQINKTVKAPLNNPSPAAQPRLLPFRTFLGLRLKVTTTSPS